MAQLTLCTSFHNLRYGTPDCLWFVRLYFILSTTTDITTITRNNYEIIDKNNINQIVLCALSYQIFLPTN